MRGALIMKSVGMCLLIGLGVLIVLSKPVVTGQVLTRAQLQQSVEVEFPAGDRDFVQQVDDVPERIRNLLADVPHDVDQVTMQAEHMHQIIFGLMRFTTRYEDRAFHEEIADDEEGRIAARRYEAANEIMERLEEDAKRLGLPSDDHPHMISIMEEVVRRTVDHAAPLARIRVRVIGQNGELLDDVGLRIAHSRPSLVPFRDPRREIADVSVSQPYEFDTKGASIISITPQKEGYYGVREIIYPAEHVEQRGVEQRIWNDVVLGRPTEHDEGEPHLIEVEIVLQKKGDLVDLYQFGADLSIRPDGSRVIGRLRVPDGHPVVRPVPEGVFTERIENSVREEEWIANDAVSVQLEFDDDGRIADLVDYTYPGMAGAVLMPQRMVLRMHDPEGGFLLYEPEDNVGRGGWRSVARQMLQAPEDGYVQELILTPEQQYHGGYFFFRNQGRYGKGGWGPVRLPRDRQSMVFRVGFYLNPTPGDRTLETGK